MLITIFTWFCVISFLFSACSNPDTGCIYNGQEAIENRGLKEVGEQWHDCSDQDWPGCLGIRYTGRLYIEYPEF